LLNYQLDGKQFAGDNRHVVDYLMAEVLHGQPRIWSASCCAVPYWED